jgi:uncharacterized protein DUF5818
MKLIGIGLALALAPVGLAAQSTTVTEKTKIEVKGGKEVTIAGCLERNPGGGYVITDSRGNLRYALVTDDDLAKHIGRRVEVKGKAADRGDGKVKIEHSVGTSGDKSETKTEMRGDRADLPYLGVKSIKEVAGLCE